MRFNLLLFLLVLSSLSLVLAQTSYEDCCLKYVKKMSLRTQRHVVAYRWQARDGGCNIEAIIFTMRKGQEVCANPREIWVGQLVRKIDEWGRGHKRPKRPRRP